MNSATCLSVRYAISGSDVCATRSPIVVKLELVEAGAYIECWDEVRPRVHSLSRRVITLLALRGGEQDVGRSDDLIGEASLTL